SADHRVAVPRAEHPVERGDAGETATPRLGAVRAEVLADLHQRALELGLVRARAYLDAHPTFSSGAYSSISRRSEPSSKRTVTTPSGSIRVTMPVPSE